MLLKYNRQLIIFLDGWVRQVLEHIKKGMCTQTATGPRVCRAVTPAWLVYTQVAFTASASVIACGLLLNAKKTVLGTCIYSSRNRDP